MATSLQIQVSNASFFYVAKCILDRSRVHLLLRLKKLGSFFQIRTYDRSILIGLKALASLLLMSLLSLRLFLIL